MIAKLKQFVILFTVFFLIFGCSTRSDEIDPYQGVPSDDLFTRGQEAVKSGYYQKAVKIYESYEAQYPLGKNSEQVLLEYIYAQYKADEHALAVAIADRYIKLYPWGKHIDYVYYLKGVINSEQERNIFDKSFPVDLSYRDIRFFKEAYNDFYTLVRRHPKSVYVADAKQRMIFIRNLLAKAELNVAQFYYERGHYLAAINRAVNVVDQYAQSPQVLSALEIIVESNKHLKLEDSMHDTLKILRINFPNSQFLQTM